MISILKRAWIPAAWLVGLFAFSAAAQEGPVRLVLGFPAGASLDTMTRLIGEHMRQGLGRPVIVENKVGAGGRVANEVVKNAAPDGATLLVTPVATMAIYPHSFGDALRYDPFRDYAPVAHLSSFHSALGIGAAIPARTLAEYVALVKRDPKAGYYASAAAGSIPHFIGVMLAGAAGINMTHVPYKGSAPAMQALAGGEIAALITVTSDIANLEKAGKARLLAIAATRRRPAFPNVPTFKEAGYDVDGEAWYALFAPVATPKPTIERLSQAAIAAVRDPAIRQRLENMGLEPTGLGPAELAAIHKADYERWGPVIRASGFKPGP
jgi:tripartite-type tricarboxylate transporter receptor subunit TctC